LLTNPKAIIEREFGVEFPTDVNVQVLEKNPTSLHFVLPISPVSIARKLSQEQLEAIAGGRTPADWKLESIKGGIASVAALTILSALQRTKL